MSHSLPPRHVAPSPRRPLCTLAALLTALALGACHARKDYFEPDPGWHSPNYSTVFGRLSQQPGPTSDSPPVWVLRFGAATGQYKGEFALTAPKDAPQRLAGYSGGEMVQVKGRLLGEATTDAFNGRWYVVDSIQLWTNYRQ